MASLSTEIQKAGAIKSPLPGNESSYRTKRETDVDEAYKFLVAHVDNTALPGMKGITRKVDWRIVPIMFLIYLFNLLDKVSLNYVAVMGLPIDLKLQGNDFPNAATAFFGAYLAAELPTPSY